MRVAVMAGSIVPGQSCGIEHFTYGLLNGLLTYTADIELYAIVPKNAKAAWIRRVPDGSKLQYISLTYSAGIGATIKKNHELRIMKYYQYMKKSELARDFFWALRSREEYGLLRKLKPDVVYYPFHRDRVNKKYARKTVVTVHDLRELQPELYNPRNARIVSNNVHLARAVVSSWKHPFDQLRILFPEANAKSFLVPFPPAMGGIDPIEVNDFTGEGEEEIVLYVSITSPHKNHVRLVQAMAEVFKRRPGRATRLVCVGSKISPGYDAALEEAKKLGIDDRINFTGFVPDEVLRKLYSKARMVVVPTLWEAASGAVYEAFSYGKPVACSRIPPLISQVEQAGAKVRFFNPLDPEDIAKAIIELLDNPAPYIQGSLKGAAYIQKLSWEKTAKKYAEIFSYVSRE